MSKVSLAVLESEGSLKNISADDVTSRLSIAEGLRSLPKEAIINLRHLLPQAGCFNACTFCSQDAKPKVWQLTERSLRNLFSAIKTVALEIANRHAVSADKPYLIGGVLSPEGVFSPGFKMPSHGLVGYGRTSHRPGVIYPYLDNDISSYPFFSQYLKYAKEDLGIKVRLSTVGYSRWNAQLQGMHELINKDYLKALAGVRVSITPYTLGWTASGERSGLTSREEFSFDLVNFLNTYRPAIEYLGAGDRAASVEFRFPPLISDSVVEEVLIGGRHVVHTGPYLLISNDVTDVLPSYYPAKIRAEGRHSIFINEWFRMYIMIISPKLVEGDGWKNVAQKISEANLQGVEEIVPNATIRQSKLYYVENDDGPYYAVDPEMTEFGYFAKEFYPLSGNRTVTGYIDSERYFLNALLKYKHSKGIGRKEQFFTATWKDADQVINLLKNKISRMEIFNPLVARHLQEYTLPLVATYRKVLEMSGYSAKYFFDKNFTIDTGEICNLGGAYREYKALTTKKNSAVTPQHERVYSSDGSLATEGKIWIIGVAPTATGSRSPGAPVYCPALYVAEQDLVKRSSVDGYTVRRWYIPLKIGDVEMLNTSNHKETYLIPGRNK